MVGGFVVDAKGFLWFEPITIEFRLKGFFAPFGQKTLLEGIWVLEGKLSFGGKTECFLSNYYLIRKQIQIQAIYHVRNHDNYHFPSSG